mmetsp:Transcript_36267/g.119500  ORF Transcript_36267/g.119500 Transcript_36267/m.119500 type:complete len:272 (+) Transcript_36267:1524-2339(+)
MHRRDALAKDGVGGGGRPLHLERHAAEVDHHPLLHVAAAVRLERGEQLPLGRVVERLATLVVDVDDVDVRLCVRVARVLVEAELRDLDPVHELALVRRDLAAAAHLVWLVVHGGEGDALDRLVHAHVDHVHLEDLRAAVRDERARHHLVVLEVAREVPVVALQNLLANEQAEPVHAAPRQDVRHTVGHQDLARAELVLHVGRRGAHDLAPGAGLVAGVAQLLHVRLGEGLLVGDEGEVARRRVLLVGGVLGAHLEVRLGPHHALALVELLL